MKKLILLLALSPSVFAVTVNSKYNATQPEVSVCRWTFDKATIPLDTPVVRDANGDKCSNDITNYADGLHNVFAQYCSVDPAGVWPDKCSAVSNTVNFSVPVAPSVAPSGLGVTK